MSCQFNFLMNADPFQGASANDASQPVSMVLGENVFDMFSQKDSFISLPLGQAGSAELAITAESPISSVPSSSSLSPISLLSMAADDQLNSNSTSNSPMFQDLELEPETWGPLFEDIASPTHNGEISNVVEDIQLNDVISEAVANVVKVKEELNESSLLTNAKPLFKRSAVNVESQTEAQQQPPNKRKKSTKMDHLGCVSYNRKQRSAPLNPIVIPNNADNAAVKRARNTEAARRSRARKMERMNQLEEKVEVLLNKNDELQKEVERLRALLGERAN
ncbi:amino acid starvation-responsive transcription factor [Saccharomycopsis crataegensis]|uniref:Amino acid starvation-responsive transcription factor n=1 Tax=Saccharomycopsis crataegensis TaxID=43959 RepID=A0AAV5QN21_9ASCO|nr:amino acid starvation-responsive transcription factor [Saccharomycopsis crataegensis]